MQASSIDESLDQFITLINRLGNRLNVPVVIQDRSPDNVEFSINTIEFSLVWANVPQKSIGKTVLERESAWYNPVPQKSIDRTVPVTKFSLIVWKIIHHGEESEDVTEQTLISDSTIQACAKQAFLKAQEVKIDHLAELLDMDYIWAQIKPNTVINFTSEISKYRTAIEPGMLARILRISSINRTTLELQLDFLEFETHNTELMPYKYFETGKPGRWCDVEQLAGLPYSSNPSDKSTNLMVNTLQESPFRIFLQTTTKV